MSLEPCSDYTQTSKQIALYASTPPTENILRRGIIIFIFRSRQNQIKKN